MTRKLNDQLSSAGSVDRSIAGRLSSAGSGSLSCSTSKVIEMAKIASLNPTSLLVSNVDVARHNPPFSGIVKF